MTIAPSGPVFNPAPDKYDRHDQHQLRELVRNELARCLKRNERLQPAELVLADTVTGTLYKITVASGTLTLTAL